MLRGTNAWGLTLCGHHTEISMTVSELGVSYEKSEGILELVLEAWSLGSRVILPPTAPSPPWERFLAPHSLVPGTRVFTQPLPPYSLPQNDCHTLAPVGTWTRVQGGSDACMSRSVPEYSGGCPHLTLEAPPCV